MAQKEPKEDEKSMVTRTRYEYLREDYEDLNDRYKEAEEAAGNIKDELCLQLREVELALAEEEARHSGTKVQLEEALEEKERVSEECERLREKLEISHRALQDQKARFLSGIAWI